jgi:hypothetical protein
MESLHPSRLRFLHALILVSALFLTAPKIQAFWMKAALPLYIYPFPAQADWQQAINAGGEKVDFIIANVHNGPGTEHSEVWARVINAASANGVKIYGYVYTSYGQRDARAVEQDVKLWLQFYPAITGFFVDETASGPDQLPYYQERYRFIKGLNPDLQVCINPGTITDERYMTACDVNVLFESPYQAWLNFIPPTWMENYNENQFYAIIYSVPERSQMVEVVAQAKQRNFGNLFVTSALSPSESLPPYFDAELDEIIVARRDPLSEPLPLQFVECSATQIGRTTATIEVSTTLPTRLTIHYWVKGSSTRFRVESNHLSANHTVILSGLQRRKTYQYEVHAFSEDGQAIVSPVHAFTTRR